MYTVIHLVHFTKTILQPRLVIDNSKCVAILTIKKRNITSLSLSAIMYSSFFCRVTWFVNAEMPLSLYLMRGGEVEYFRIMLEKIPNSFTLSL